MYYCRLRIGQVEAKPGDIVFADEGERVAAVIPQDKLHAVMALLPKLKTADDGVLTDVVKGGDLKKAFGENLDVLQQHFGSITDILSSS